MESALMYLAQFADVTALATRLEVATMASMTSAPMYAFTAPALAALSSLGA